MEEVIVEGPLAGICTVRINRPEARNALNRNVRSLLAKHIAALGQDAEARVIVLTGGDKVFVAGADLREFEDCSSIDMYLRHTHLLWRAIADCPKPIIAAVNGYALGGGCELAMHADIIVAGRSASFAQPEIRLGLMPGAGGTQRLTRAVGKFRAMKMVLTGQAITADEALSMGLVSEVVADDAVQGRAQELAGVIAAMSPIAVAQIKEVLLAGQDASLDAALALERKAFQLLFSTEDQKEGVRAFFDKRKPSYKGR